MDTKRLEQFAQQTRRKLLEQVEAKLEYVTNGDTAELRDKAQLVKKLKNEWNRLGKEALVDRVAYTWFNRFAALRYMDVRGFQPLEVSILTPREGRVRPQILEEALSGHIPDKLKVDRGKVMELINRQTSEMNPENEAYRLLLVAACNHLHSVFPFLFEEIDDYTELLLPDDLTSEFSVIHDIVEGMAEEDCQHVEVLGWLYQFYISEKKNEVFASKGKVEKEEIPAATQLFTPRWIVEFMVQNTVGKLWLFNNPGSDLRKAMPYYIENAEISEDDVLRINRPEELTLLDQACGSGHILVYGFELLYRIYEEEGYAPSEIPSLIIEHNLHGFEIDERAAQLAGLAVLMKAREYQRRLFRKADVPVPNITCFEDLPVADKDLKTPLKQTGVEATPELMLDLERMQQATNLGSLIQPETPYRKLDEARQKCEKTLNNSDLFERDQLEHVLTALQTLMRLAEKYVSVVDNPPYMGSGKMNKLLSDFVKSNYPDSKSDLLTCFMERAHSHLKENGFLSMINLPSWMFLSSFEKFRENFIANFQIESLLHLGRGIFGADFGTVAFSVRKTTNEKKKGVYRRLFKKHVQVRNSDKIEKLFLNKDYGFYTANQKDYEKIPGSPIGYWVSKSMIQTFIEGKSLKSFAPPKQGLATGNNDFFLRLWFEVSTILKNEKWIPINKGGPFKKWFGNNLFVVNWENNGYLLKNYRDYNGKLKSRPQNQDYYFKEGITWSTVSSGAASFRYSPPGHLFETKGSTLFPSQNELLNICGFLNTKIVKKFLMVLSPTIDYHEGPLGKVPYLPRFRNESLVQTIINGSKSDWDCREVSREFQQNELIRLKNNDSVDLEETYDLYKQYWKNKFHQLHQNEEELNRQFIEIYGLEEELTPDVPLEEITILQDETKIKNGELVFKPDEVFAQFVSYAVGCMFGRYSLDKVGLILANQGETVDDYLEKVNLYEDEVSFLPDTYNIIPVLDDDWFEDDIVSRFHTFLKVNFGEDNFQKNLSFLETQLGKDLRKYFVRDFYKDHVKRYKKRPIYWKFSSPKGHFSVLIYMHRYTPDTLNNILNRYLREFLEKLKTHKEHMQHLENTGTTGEKAKAAKEIDKLNEMIKDCEAYEREILFPLASERIEMDLDDGVLVNYNLFGEAVEEIKSVNDSKTKKKVKGFDWIDGSRVR